MTTTAKKTDKTPGATALLEEVRNSVGTVGGALGAGGKAYVSGIVELASTLGGFGREILNETGEHVRAVVQAKCLSEVADLQAAFVQKRIEMTATHSKEIVDLARVKAEAAISPITVLLSQKVA